MAEYKGKLLKGIFTKASKCLLSNGESVENAFGRFKTAVVSGTMPSTVNTEAQIPLPNGFDAQKTFILGFMTKTSSTYYSNSNQNVNVFTTSGIGIRISTTNTNFCSQSVWIVIAQTE